MHSISYHNIKQNYFSLLLGLFPLSFIAGNMIINLNIILIILSSLFLYKTTIFKMRYFLFDKLIFLYFLLLLFTAVSNDFYFYSNDIGDNFFITTFKSILFFKYLLLYLSLRRLIQDQIINLKLFFILCFLSTIFVCFDIFYQFINGKDFFGYEMNVSTRKLGGPFGDELIAGGYIQRFSIFSFFILPLFYSKYSVKYSSFFVPILFIIFLVGIILSGNRMPLLLFIFTLFLMLIFQKQLRKYLLSTILMLSIIFFSIYNMNENVKKNFLSFYSQVNSIVEIALKDNNFKEKPQYLKEFSTFYDTWLMHKYIGGGIKNFRYYCHERPNIKKDVKFVCNMHPHNYYLEILTETGLFGFLILVVAFVNILYTIFYNKYFIKHNLNENIMIIPFIFLFIVEIFPIKSTGSFFTTGNTTYLFLILGILIGLSQRDISIEKKI